MLACVSPSGWRNIAGFAVSFLGGGKRGMDAPGFEPLDAGLKPFNGNLKTIGATFEIMNASLDLRETVFEGRHFGTHGVDFH
jgi:hypothetical protein